MAHWETVKANGVNGDVEKVESFKVFLLETLKKCHRGVECQLLGAYCMVLAKPRLADDFAGHAAHDDCGL